MSDFKKKIHKAMLDDGVDIEKESLFTRFIFNSLLEISDNATRLQAENKALREGIVKALGTLDSPDTPVSDAQDILEQAIEGNEELEKIAGGILKDTKEP